MEDEGIGPLSAKAYRTVLYFMIAVLIVIIVSLLVTTGGRQYVATQFLNGRSYSLVALVYYIGLIFVMVFDQIYRKEMYEIAATCLVPADREFIDTVRGMDYGRNEDMRKENPKQFDTYRRVIRSCLVTGWSALHFILYFILGFIAPELLWIIVLVGIGFEVVEGYLGCYDMLDVVYNTLGAITGAVVRRALLPV